MNELFMGTSRNLSRKSSFGTTARSLRALFVVSALALGGVLTSAKPSVADSAKKPPLRNLKDLPDLMLKMSSLKAAQQAQASASGTKRVATRKSPLIEVDLTPGTPSDDREPTFRNDGDVIAFSSNRTSTGQAVGGFYHIWIMNRDGSNPRQVTGLAGTPTAGRNQRQPKWSRNGNEIAYSDQLDANTTQIFVAFPFATTPTQQRTFFPGIKIDPVFSSGGSELLFATKTNPSTGAALPSYDLFAIPAAGGTTSVRRLTGGPTDPIGDSTDDRNPAFSVVSGNVIFFSSNRAIVNGAAATISSRRIWAMQDSGLNKRQISDPTKRSSGVDSDSDDFPTTSRPISPNGNFFSDGIERVAFQSNSLIDASDSTRDLNIWSLPVDSTQYAPAPAQADSQPKSLLVGSYNTDRVRQYDPVTGASKGNFTNATNADGFFENSHVEGVVFGAALKDVGTGSTRNDNVRDLLVCLRDKNNGAGVVAAYDGVSGQYLGVLISGYGLTNPAGIYYDENGSFGQGYIYVSSGFGGSAPISSNRVHRFFADTGLPAPVGNNAADNSVFTDGDGIAGGTAAAPSVADIGLEGIDIDRNQGELYVSVLLDNKINIYSRFTGKFIRTFADATDGISRPTDIKLSSDKTRLYVANSGTGVSGDDGKILIFDVVTGNVVRTITNGVFAPEGIVLGPSGNFYVSNFLSPGNSREAELASGHIVNRFTAAGDPLPAPGGQTGAVFINDSALRGAGYMVFTPSFLSSSTPVVNLPAANSTAETADNPAVLESNTYSSRNSFAVSGLPGANGLAESQSDKSADREPSFARSTASSSIGAQIVFASQRQRAYTPQALLVPPSGGVNPFGGAQDMTKDSPPTHDIWTTQVEDFTPPILVPQSAGNQLYPVVSPGPQAPTADGKVRTFETGLTPGGKMRFGIVLQEKESGVKTVKFSVIDADQPTFFTRTSKVNDDLDVRIANEGKAKTAAGFGSLPMAPYDDGPPTARSRRTGQPGHELQAGAVEGDGVFYCEAIYNVPNLTSDFYLDVDVADNSGNTFSYDNVWGFSTRQFVKQGRTDLFISDYTAGQSFSGNFDFSNGSFGGVTSFSSPVESYYLDNPAGKVIDEGDPNIDFDDTILASTSNVTFPNVDVWRVQCRGQVPETVLASYAPTVSLQYDPQDFLDSKPDSPVRRKRLAVAESSIIWASPYTGSLFVGPGTLQDSEMQRRLTNFLGGGGRLFITGPSVIYALSNAGLFDNTFLTKELHVQKYSGATGAEVLKGDVGRFTDYGCGADVSICNPDNNNFQFPRDPTDDKERNKNLWTDAAFNGSNFGLDIITPVGADASATLTPAYTAGETLVGQRVQTLRTGGGIESRLVFFSFGFEGVNRRYGAKGGPQGIDVRARAAGRIRSYFKTQSVSGTVFNTKTNLPIPGIVLKVSAGGNTVVAITDARGQYDVLGIPEGGASISLAKKQDGTPLNEGYLPNTTSFGTSSGVNFYLTPTSPGSLSGRAVLQDGTASFDDNLAFANSPVLLVSKNTSSLFVNGGRFAQLTTTDVTGSYSFANVPSSAELRVIFNPDPEDIPESSGLRASYAGPNSLYGKRIVGDDGDPRRSGVITVPPGDRFVLNDGINDDFTDNTIPVVINDGVTITGNVILRANGVDTPLQGATVTLSGNGVLQNRTTNAQGVYTFDDIKPTNNVTYSLKIDVPQTRFTRTISVTVPNRTTITVPDVIFSDHRIDGLVVSSTGGNDTPAVGATVVLTGPNGIRRTTTTGPKGAYSFSSLDAGNYTVTASTTGSSGSVSVSLANGNNAIAPTIKFNVQIVKGFVRLLHNGNPNKLGLVGAKVYLNQNGQTVSSGTSGANGAFSLDTTRTGNFIVVASFFNAVSNIAPITVATGQTQSNVELIVRLQSISGKITLDGAPLPNARVNLSKIVNGTKQFVATKQTDNAGNYLFIDRNVGTYQVDAIAAGDTAGTPQFFVPENGLNRPAPTIAFRTQSISGVVRFNGAVVSGATVQLQQGAAVIKTTVTGANGTFSFAKLGAGNYILRAFSGSLKSTDVPVTVQKDKDVTGVTLTLLNQSVTGRVIINGLPAAGANITLSGNGIAPQTTNTGNDGRYSFGSVPAGTYNVQATRVLLTGQDSAATTFTSTTGPTSVRDIVLFAETITGRVTVNGAFASGVSVGLSVRNSAGAAGNIVRTTTTDGNGSYSFNGLGAGGYAITASRNGDSIQVPVDVPRNGQTITAPVIALRLQNIVGSVVYNGSAASGAVVKLTPGNLTATTSPSGTYQFTGVNQGTYTVSTTFKGLSGSRSVTVARGADIVAPTIVLGTGTAPAPTNDFVVGRVYHFSIPFTDATAPFSTTTVSKALSLPPTNGTTVNYLLRKYDATKQVYVPITDPNAIIQRGVGYAIEPKSGPVRIKRPADDPTRLPTAVTKFEVTLRLDPSPTSTDNGNNFIGFPFDPARTNAVALWSKTTFVAPPGGARAETTTYANLNEAVAANIVAREIYYFDGTNYVLTDRIEPFRAYFVRTYVDNVRATLSVETAGN